MSTPTSLGLKSTSDLDRRLAPLKILLGEINDLKRVRVAGRSGSLADQGFVRSWEALIRGLDPGLVARREVAFALASTRLGGIDATVLADGGLHQLDIETILRASIAEVAGPSSPWNALVATVIADLADSATFAEDGTILPHFVERLRAQPRAGATRPGYARLVLEPPENHAEHCYITAVYAALLAPEFGADPAVAFLAGLVHHFHNAYLPDSGFAGEELLGEHLASLMDRFAARAEGQLPAQLAAKVKEARAILPDAATPAGQAFHAGDVFDRVLQMEQYARVAAFETRQALDDLDLVHPGPLQAFHQRVLAAVGLLP